MDPTILRLLQGAGGTPQQQEGQEGGDMQPMGQSQQPMQAIQGSTVTNPFDAGIKSAIQSARESLGATKAQKERMMQNSILTFGNEMGKLPRGRGFLENFANVGKAVAPAMLGYNKEEEAAEGLNQGLAQEILAQNLRTQTATQQEEDRDWYRNHAEDQLAEQRRYHDLMGGRYSQSGGTANEKDTAIISSLLGQEVIPIEGRTERASYLKQRKGTGEVIKELKDIQKDYEQFRALVENDAIDPQNPYIGQIINPVKDVIGYFGKDPHLQAETKARQRLNSKLDQFTLDFERKKRGGVLTGGMIKFFEQKDILPSLKGMGGTETFEGKLADLLRHADEEHEAADLSLKYGAHLTPDEVKVLKEKLEQRNSEQVNSDRGMAQNAQYSGGAQNTIDMISPQGEIKSVDMNDVRDAIGEGYVPIK